MKQILSISFFCLIFASCSTKEMDYPKGTFGHDLAFLQKNDDSLIVLKKGKTQIIVSAKYQGKVFTSTAEGMEGTSFGWINYKAFNTTDPHINAYGGENRLWLGPEGGKFSLFFPKDAKMEFANWKTPAAFDTEPWTLVKRDGVSVHLEKDMQLVNYAGTSFNIGVKRNITVMDKEQVSGMLGVGDKNSIKVVGYFTENRLTNTGQQAWTDSTGTPCIWMLDMFNPSPATVVIIPFEAGKTAKPVTTDYFGKIPADRLRLDSTILFFKADGKKRCKLGIHPLAAKNVAGSYDAEKKILTIVLFDVDKTGRYLNQEWNTTKPPFSGDAVNSYNDGPLEDGGQLGPFYELESVSPAAFLQPGESLFHGHGVFHFTGDEKDLDEIARRFLKAGIDQIKNAFASK